MESDLSIPLSFSLAEILSLVGLSQAVYVLVYMTFHAGNRRQAFFPFLYFLAIGCAFFLDFADDFIGETFALYAVMQWSVWFLVIPLSVLLMVQLSTLDNNVTYRYHWVLWPLPLAMGAAFWLARGDPSCVWPSSCVVLTSWLIIWGSAAGIVALAGVWGHRHLFSDLKKQKKGRERYWLITGLIFCDLLFVFFMMAGESPLWSRDDIILIRSLLGLGFVYLVGTGLFRLYPQVVTTAQRTGHQALRGEVKREDRPALSAEETALIGDIERLLTHEKIYQEPSYARSDLAQELGISESVLSKIINGHFQRSFPQLLNEKRIDEARHFLEDTDISVKHIAEECGFSSLSTFNRVFKEVMDCSPTSYRNKLKNNNKR